MSKKNNKNNPPPGGPVESFKNKANYTTPPEDKKPHDDNFGKKDPEDKKELEDVPPEDPTPEDKTETQDSQDKERLERAIFLLKEAQRGMTVIIDGIGPCDDHINGIYYQSRHESFLLSLWNEELDKLLKESGHV